MKTVISRAFVPGPQSKYIRDRCAFIKALQLLGLIDDVRVGRIHCLDGKVRWALTLESRIDEP